MLLSSPLVILQFLVVAAAFAVIDAVRLKLMNPFYRSHIGDLLADRPNLGYAVAFYVMYIAGVLRGAALTGLSTLAGWLVFQGRG
jgi:uncharacterized membrane protein